MKNAYKVKRLVLPGFLILAVLFSAAAVFISQMNHMIYSMTLNTVQEIAAHDQISIENYLERSWEELDGIYRRLVTYEYDTTLSVQQQMSLERSTCGFHTLYLVAEDGTVYNDRYMVYSREDKDLQSYLQTDEEYIACRYDYTMTTNEEKEMLLYARALDDYVVEGIHFTHLVGISPINQIQKHMVIYSFFKDGEYRGYTSVIDMEGDYIVNTEHTVSLNRRKNLYDLLEKGVSDSLWDNGTVRAGMEANESFQVTYNDEGVVKFLFFIPVEGVSWYLVTAVNQCVFTDLSRAFIISSVFLIFIALVLSACMFLLFMRYRKNAITASADARARSEFLSNMSHEIRTPLNGITGLLHLMETHLGEGNMEQMLAWIQKARDTSQYLLSLINNILDMSKLQAGKLNLNMEPFLIDQMLTSIETMQRDNAASRGVELILTADCPYSCIVGDEVRVKQVLMNIVGNAVKFTPSGGSIRLSAYQEMEADGWITTTMICVDTGVGMSQDFQEHIWDSFSQERNKVSDGTSGTGLGMPISKGIIDAMGGEINVFSEPKKGSTFTVILHSKAGQMPVSDGTQESDLLPEETKMKLLVVEDNELNAEILLEILRDEGFEAVWAENGKLALDVFRESALGEFDMILMDMQMPVMDGCQATAAIRALSRADAKNVVILACTANSFQEDRERALLSGMDDFLAKPIDIRQLLEKLALYQKRKAEKA